MTTRKRLIFLWMLLPLLTSTLACKATSLAWDSAGLAPITPSPTATNTALPTTETFTPLPPTATHTPVPPTATYTPTPTHTSSPTATPSATPEQVAQVTPSPGHFRIFDEVWGAVDEYYLYPDFNGLDWQAVYSQYRQRIEGGLSDDEFYRAMNEMIFGLGDDHSAFFSPQEADDLDQEYAGDYDYVGIGVLTSVVYERQRLTILLVFPDSPAEAAGLKAHDSLIAIDDVPLVDENGPHFQLLRGPEGSQIVLTVQSPGEEPRQVSLARQRINSILPVPYQVLQTPDGKRVGYLMLTTFQDSNVDDQTGEALKAMSAAGPLDGLIIDNRYNGGGSSEVLSNTLAYFADGIIGNFVLRNDKHPLVIEGVDIGGSQEAPLVVLVGEETASFGEIFSGVLRDIGRATIVGETTNGNVEILSVFNFSDGSRAWIAVQTFQPLNNPDQDWEQTGIIPDEIAIGSWDLYTLIDDPTVIAALDHLDSLQ